MILHERYLAAESALEVVHRCAVDVFAEFAGTSEESRFEKALETALRLEGLTVETQRIVPVVYRGCALRDVRDELDLVVWIQGESYECRKLAIVIELKVDAVPQDQLQLFRYIKSLSLVLPPQEAVYSRGLLVSFPFEGVKLDRARGEVDTQTNKVLSVIVEVKNLAS